MKPFAHERGSKRKRKKNGPWKRSEHLKTTPISNSEYIYQNRRQSRNKGEFLEIKNARFTSNLAVRNTFP